jgi:hypothetical protein
MKLIWNKWAYTLFHTVISGVGAAGTAWLGLLVGNQVNENVKPLDWEQFGFVLLTSSIISLLSFLKQSPLPKIKGENDTTL